MERKFGVVTEFKALSSNYPVKVDPVTGQGENGHPGESHSMGGGADALFHGWPDEWIAVATLEFVQLARKCFGTMFTVFMGSNEKIVLEQLANKRLSFTKVLDDGAHNWSSNLRSHFHMNLRATTINWDEVNKITA